MELMQTKLILPIFCHSSTTVILYRLWRDVGSSNIKYMVKPSHFPKTQYQRLSTSLTSTSLFLWIDSDQRLDLSTAMDRHQKKNYSRYGNNFLFFWSLYSNIHMVKKKITSKNRGYVEQQCKKHCGQSGQSYLLLHDILLSLHSSLELP